jgi:hypothetical protein
MEKEYFRGNARKLEDLDLPRIGKEIGVGEDVIHMLIEVETRGTGFDKQKRVIMLFEPHIFDKMLRKDPEKRQRARSQGLAYPEWGTRKYPKDSYPRFLEACEIDETAAYASCSWGLGQIMGMNHKMAGYRSPQAMVEAFAESEANQLDAMVEFAKAANIDDDLAVIDQILRSGRQVTPQDCIPIARGWNGSGFAKHNYHGRLAAAANKWHRIKDTPFTTSDLMGRAKEESKISDAKSQVFEEDEISAETETIKEAENKEKGVTTSTLPPEQTEGTPPPTPAVEIKASQPSLMSRISAVSFPTGAGAVILAIKTFVVGIPPWGWGIIGGSFIILCLVGAWLYNESMKRADARTARASAAAADKDKNNIRYI